MNQAPTRSPRLGDGGSAPVQQDAAGVRGVPEIRFFVPQDLGLLGVEKTSHRQEGTLPGRMPIVPLVVNCRDRLLGRTRCADRFPYGLGLPHLLLLRINEVIDRLPAVAALGSGNPSGRCQR